MRSPDRRVIAVLVGALVVLSTGLSVLAREAQESAAASPNWLRVDVVNVVPDRYDDYIQLQLEEVNPALKQAGVPWRAVWRTAEFGNSYELQFVSPIGDLSDYDTGGPVARVMRPDRFRRLVDRLRTYTVTRRSYAVEYRQELSVESDQAAELFLARVATIQIAPGRASDWEAFLLESLPKFRGADVVFGVYRWLFGPGPATWQIVENHASFSDLAQPSIVARAFGDQASGVVSELAGVVVSIERTVLRYDAELSYSGIPAR